MWLDPMSLDYKVFTYSKFLRRLRDILQSLGLPAKDFAKDFGGGRAGLPFVLVCLSNSS